MLKIWKIIAAGAGLWAVLRLFYGWKWVQGARAASIICHTYPRHSFTCCTHSKHGSEPADKRARRFLETQDLGRENSRPARRAYVALPGAASTPHYCRLLGCMQPSYLFSDLARAAPELLFRVNHSVKANKSALTTNPRCAASNQPKLFRAASVESAPSPDISMNARNT